MSKNFNFKRPTDFSAARGAAGEELAKMLGVTVAETSAETKPPQIEMLNLDFLDHHPLQHCYSMDEEELEWLTENIREHGVMEPIHVLKKENGRYTILAGHRRSEASRRAGLLQIPTIVEQLDEDAAIIMFDSTNLGQRRSLKPSERAAAYLRIEKASANKHLDQHKTSAVVSQVTGDNIRTIQRYKRLNNLIPEFLRLVDDGGISFICGVELSFLSGHEQEDLLTLLEMHHKTTVTEAKARMLKEEAQKGELRLKSMEAILFPKKPAPEQSVKIPIGKLEHCIPPGLDNKELLDYIINALEVYFENRQNDKVEKNEEKVE